MNKFIRVLRTEITCQAEERGKFGIDIDNDIAKKSDEAALESLLNDAEKWREEKRSKTKEEESR
jgi:hypothetical protein